MLGLKAFGVGVIAYIAFAMLSMLLPLEGGARAIASVVIFALAVIVAVRWHGQKQAERDREPPDPR